MKDQPSQSTQTLSTTECQYYTTSPLPLATPYYDTPIRSISSSYAERVSSVVGRNILTNKSIASMATECHMSISTFKRHFFALYGSQPHKWIIAQRLSFAEQLVATTAIPIKIISHRCGFCSESHFIRRFKQCYGRTPMQYRTALLPEDGK